LFLAYQVVETVLPQILAGEHVQLRAGRALGEDSTIDGNLSVRVHQLLSHASRATFFTYMALKHSCERFALFLGRSPEMDCSGGITRSISVLTSRVAAIDDQKQYHDRIEQDINSLQVRLIAAEHHFVHLARNIVRQG
jgi:hypothetical protein